jgi:dTDP-4-dehydrorhamnose reductase
LALQQVLQAEQHQAEAARCYAGIYHLATRGYCSWYQFAAEIFSLARQHGIALALQPEQFKPISTAEYPTPATRPANSRLNVSKLEQRFSLQLPDWQQQLALTFEQGLS